MVKGTSEVACFFLIFWGDHKHYNSSYPDYNPAYGLLTAPPEPQHGFPSSTFVLR